MEKRQLPRLRGQHICKFYARGRCSRIRCPFLHTDVKKKSLVWSRSRDQSSSGNAIVKVVKRSKEEDLPSEYVVNCKFPRFDGDYLSMLSNLSGHSKALSGIALPSNSDKLYSASSDGIVRIWDCHTGKTVQIINTGDTIGSLITEGPWVFVGMQNMVKAWNLESLAEFNLNGPIKKVQSMVIARDMLFAGAQSGVISVWKMSVEISNFFQLVASLEGHSGAILCLSAGANMLYSGATDSSIRVWSLETLHCVHKLTQHSDSVTSFVWWNQYMLSSSLDKTVKVWSCIEEDKPPDVIYTHKENDAIISLSGIINGEGKPILLCSSMDAHVRLYELPSFTEKGKIISEIEVRKVEAGPHGLLFTGDENGQLSVWKLAEGCSKPKVVSSEAKSG